MYWKTIVNVREHMSVYYRKVHESLLKHLLHKANLFALTFHKVIEYY